MHGIELEKKILPEIKIASFMSNVFLRFPSISFGALNRDERIWRTGCAIMRGETNYEIIKNKLNSLGGIYRFLSIK